MTITYRGHTVVHYDRNDTQILQLTLSDMSPEELIDIIIGLLARLSTPQRELTLPILLRMHKFLSDPDQHPEVSLPPIAAAIRMAIGGEHREQFALIDIDRIQQSPDPLAGAGFTLLEDEGGERKENRSRPFV